jgi:hypothetical protein
VAFGFSSVLRLVSGVGGFSAGVLIRDASRGFGARRLHALVITQSSIINQSSKHYTNKQTNKLEHVHPFCIKTVTPNLCVVVAVPSRLTNSYPTILD